MTDTPYDVMISKLSAFEDKPYAIRMGHRDWVDLKRDARTRLALKTQLGDPVCFMGVPVRLDGKRISGIPMKWDAQVFATAEELHDAIYG